MVLRLPSQVVSHSFQNTGAHAVNAVPLCPVETTRRPVTFLRGQRRAGSFQPLEQLGNTRCGMHPDQQVHVGLDHPNFEDEAPLLAGQGA